MKTKIIAKIFLFLLSTVFIIQCEENCPEFNTDILNWAPYKVDDTISLYKDDSIKNFIVLENQINHGEVEKFHLGCQKCSACDEDEYIVKMTFDSINIQICYYSSKNPLNSRVILNDFTNSLETAIYPDTTISNYVLNEKYYGTVMIFNNSNYPIHDSKIQKIIIAKSYGIIAIFEIQGTWYLKSDLERKITISESRFNGIEGC